MNARTLRLAGYGIGLLLALVLPLVLYPVLALDIVAWGLFAVALDLLLDGGQDLREALVVVRVARLEAELGQLNAGQVLGVAAELDVDAAAGHVGRDRDGERAARLRDHLALPLGVLGLRVQHRVRDAAPAQLLREHL